ncbi:hypothetical protein [Arthrobacter sp. GMC3]|uniref:hypothetical protein n=1 Tax=Arthrobacter sp. GMC3 TaxID=2058894 RepID=UPI0011B0B123|nr:hypothetical protein [Arthrobacter sp. GMC3]
MHIGETLKSIGRRWYVVLLGILLTVGLAYMVNTRVPTTYESKGSILIMPPKFTVGAEGNPYLFLSGMNQAVDVLVRRASAPEVTAPLLNRFPGASYTVAADGTTSSPILMVTANASTEAQSLLILDAALKSVDATLSIMQDEASVKDINRVHGQELVVDKVATPKTKTKIQLLLAAVGAGSIGTLWLAGLVDGWIIGRQQRMRRASKNELAIEHDTETNGVVDKPPTPTRRRKKKEVTLVSEVAVLHDVVASSEPKVETATSNKAKSPMNVL